MKQPKRRYVGSGSTTNDEVAAPKKTWVAVLLNALFPGAGYIYVGSSRFWNVILIVVFAALTVVMAAVSPGWLFLNFWARVFFAIHAGYKAVKVSKDPYVHIRAKQAGGPDVEKYRRMARRF